MCYFSLPQSLALSHTHSLSHSLSHTHSRTHTLSISPATDTAKARRPHTASPSRHDIISPLSPDKTNQKKGPDYSINSPQRPITASARVESSSENRNNERGSPENERNDNKMRPKSAISDVPDDALIDEEEYENGTGGRGHINHNDRNEQNEQNDENDRNDQNEHNDRNDRNDINYNESNDGQYTDNDMNGNNIDTRQQYNQRHNDDIRQRNITRGLYGDVDSIDQQDTISLNDNTLLTEPDEFNFGPSSQPATRGEWDSLNGSLENQNSDGMYVIDDTNRSNRQVEDGNRRHGHDDSYKYESEAKILLSDSDGRDGRGSERDHPNRSNNRSNVHFEASDYSITEPIEHLEFLASQTLAAVRDMVLTRHRAGKPLVEVFRHFDRVGKTYFDSIDFIKATSDLRIETTEKVGALAVAQIALDGRDSVTYGEFKVYILDPDHQALQQFIIQHMAEQLQRQGKAFQTLLHSVFWDEENLLTRTSTAGENRNEGSVSLKAFLSAIKKLLLRLSQSDTDRVVTRFDIHGQMKFCSAIRFIKMIERSELWQHAEDVLVHQYHAEKEASVLRAEQSNRVAGSSGGN